MGARDFLILGDPIIAEVLQTPTARQPGSRRTVREQFEFEIMRVPFEVGHGQFVMHEAALRGVLVRAHMSGKVDFRRHLLDIGGTYVPMSGLMRVPAEIPTARLLTGPRGEGLFGITFGIKGSMERPQVIVNPLSLITPGIFREVFQMAPRTSASSRASVRLRHARTARAPSAPAGDPAGAGAIVPGVHAEVVALVGGSGSTAPAQAPRDILALFAMAHIGRWGASPAPRYRRMIDRSCPPPRRLNRAKGCVMTDKTTIEINVDTFSDADGFFVRTEIEARSVNISGPFPNLEAAQGLKARQLANRERWRRHSRSNCGAPAPPCPPALRPPNPPSLPAIRSLNRRHSGRQASTRWC